MFNKWFRLALVSFLGIIISGFALGLLNSVGAPGATHGSMNQGMPMPMNMGNPTYPGMMSTMPNSTMMPYSYGYGINMPYAGMPSSGFMAMPMGSMGMPMGSMGMPMMNMPMMSMPMMPMGGSITPDPSGGGMSGGGGSMGGMNMM